MPLDRDSAREAIERYDAKFDSFTVSSMHPGYPGEWMEELLDVLEGCVTPRLAEVDVRIISEAEAKLARVRALCDEVSDGAPIAVQVREILDAPS